MNMKRIVVAGTTSLVGDCYILRFFGGRGLLTLVIASSAAICIRIAVVAGRGLAVSSVACFSGGIIC